MDIHIYINIFMYYPSLSLYISISVSIDIIPARVPARR